MNKVEEVRSRLISYMEDRLKIMQQIDELVERKRLIQSAIAATEDELLFAIEAEGRT